MDHIECGSRTKPKLFDLVRSIRYATLHFLAAALSIGREVVFEAVLHEVDIHDFPSLFVCCAGGKSERCGKCAGMIRQMRFHAVV